VTENESPVVLGFSDLCLPLPIQSALADIGYERPTPIQSLAIPTLLSGQDILGQAQTGTGKTAAFALPFLSKIDPDQKDVQLLVLTPTRELAIQVADDFAKYSAHIRKLQVLPIYGGQEYGVQLRALKKGVHVVIGTPGRVMDHMRRGRLNLEQLRGVVLDEADEMLHMGFIDDVEWILEQTSPGLQMALFSATMPKSIRNIAKRHLNNPKELFIESRTTAAESIRQRYLIVPGARKIDALIRILEYEDFDAVIVFVKTKNATLEVAEKLAARGHSACALNGDLSQSLRERTVNQLKAGKLDIIVATDIAARGLDVERISHVVNYDAPSDAEPYVHRIGRTGRAGRTGKAILFLTPRDKKILQQISRATKQKIELMDIPSIKVINKRRIQKLNEQITETLRSKDISFFKDLIENYHSENDASRIDVAAAVAHLAQGDAPLLLEDTDSLADAKKKHTFADEKTHGGRKNRPASIPDHGMERYRVEVGSLHDVRPANIVGAIANEAGIGSEHIGRINIYNDHSTVDLPVGMPKKTLKLLQRVWVCNTQLKILKEDDGTRSGRGANQLKFQHEKKKHMGRKKNRTKKGSKSRIMGRKSAA
jgi:ATP-dependent RNA helicase DeaD